MKILVPIDFSGCAQYALNTAILIAKKRRAEIHIYNCADIDDLDYMSLSDRQYKEKMKTAILSWTKEKLENAKQLVENRGVSCITHMETGNFLNRIQTFVSKVKFDLIVMGSHGASGKKEWLIGSNTQKVVRKLHNTVLVVKNDMDKLDFSKALFVSNLNIEDQEAFRYFLEFISNYDVEEVHIMCVNTEGFFSQPTILIHEALNTFKEIAEGFNAKTHFYPEFSIDAGVRHFSEENDIKLIAISNRVRHPFKRIFQGSNVEMIVNHSKVPVLSIDY